MDPSPRLCPNCGAAVTGAFCAACGQRYRDRKETFGQLVYEFVGSFTNFDSRFFHTLIPLLFRPGKATKEYMDGRQASQLHPVRLYLFSSFLYFLLFFSCGKGSVTIDRQAEHDSTRAKENNDWVIAPMSIQKGKESKATVASDADSTFKMSITGVDGLDTLFRDNVSPDEYRTMQAALPRTKRDNLVKQYIVMRSLELYKEGKDTGGTAVIRRIVQSVLENIPKTLFVLLPLFALLLKLLYVRRRQFNYVDHAVLSLHFFSLMFILLLFAQFILDPLFGTNLFLGLAIVWLFIYFFLAMRRIYGQGFFKTLVKYLILGGLFTGLVIIAFLVNFFVSAFVG